MLLTCWIMIGFKKMSNQLCIPRINPTSVQFSLVAQSCPTLRPHESQHARPPCPSPSPRVHSDSCPLSPWCHPAISSWVVPFSSCPQIPPSIRVFSNESTLRMRCPKYWIFSFSIIPSKEIPGLISFRMDWLDLLAVQGALIILFYISGFHLLEFSSGFVHLCSWEILICNFSFLWCPCEVLCQGCSVPIKHAGECFLWFLYPERKWQIFNKCQSWYSN